MCPIDDDVVASALSAWLTPIIGKVQCVVLQAAFLDPDEAHTLLTGFAGSLLPPKNQVERVLIRSVLSELAGRLGLAIHERWHSKHEATKKCSFVPGNSHDRFSSASDDPVEAFRQWADRFFAEFADVHPRSPSLRIAKLLKSDYQAQWDLPKLARFVHLTPSQLRRAFEREYGMSPREYLRQARILEAVGHMSNTKIESIATQLGYRSPKSFYHAFHQLTGMTPAAFRRLQPEDANEIAKNVALPPGERFPGSGARSSRQRFVAASAPSILIAAIDRKCNILKSFPAVPARPERVPSQKDRTQSGPWRSVRRSRGRAR